MTDKRADETTPLSEARLAEIRAQLADVERARDVLTKLGGPEWSVNRPRAPFVEAIRDLLAEVERQRAALDLAALAVQSERDHLAGYREVTQAEITRLQAALTAHEARAAALAGGTYKLWDYTADYEAQNVAYPWAVYAPGQSDLAGVLCWCVSRERAQIVCDALNGAKEVARLRAREAAAMAVMKRVAAMEIADDIYDQPFYALMDVQHSEDVQWHRDLIEQARALVVAASAGEPPTQEDDHADL